jgi:hypothetical protein
LAVSSTDHQSVFPRFPAKLTGYMVCLWRRNTRDYSTSMWACCPENGCYALLADCTERNATEYADVNQQIWAKSVENKFEIMALVVIWNDQFFIFTQLQEVVGITFYVLGDTEREKDRKGSNTDASSSRVSSFKNSSQESWYVIGVIFYKRIFRNKDLR